MKNDIEKRLRNIEDAIILLAHHTGKEIVFGEEFKSWDIPLGEIDRVNNHLVDTADILTALIRYFRLTIKKQPASKSWKVEKSKPLGNINKELDKDYARRIV